MNAAGANEPWLEELRRIHQEATQADPARRLDLEAPKFGGRLVVRYRPVEWIEAKRIGQRWAKSQHPKAILFAQADLLALACEEVLRYDDDGQLVSIGEGDTPVRFDGAVERLGIEVANAREAVFQILTEIQVSVHHEELSDWSQAAPLVKEAASG